MKRRVGFTLLELLIVVIIVGVLASLALPRFFRGVERARWAEAKSALGALRGAQIRYFAERSVWTDAITDLDVDFQAGRFFTFSVSTASSEVAQAIRNTINNAAGVPATTTYIYIGEDGTYKYSTGFPAWLQ